MRAILVMTLVILFSRTASACMAPPAPAKACDDTAHIRISPNGWASVTAHVKHAGSDNSFCLEPTWHAPEVTVLRDDGSLVGTYCPVPGVSYSFPDDGHHHGYATLEIRDASNQDAIDVMAARLRKLAGADVNYTKQIDKSSPAVAAYLAAHITDTVEALEAKAAERLIRNNYPNAVVYRGALPIAGGANERIILGAWDGASVSPLDLQDGTALDVFAFDIERAHPQDVEVTQGAPVSPDTLGSTLLKVFGALGPPIGALGGGDPVDLALTTFFNAKCAPGGAGTCQATLHEVTATYTSVRVSSTVVGGFNYSVQVCRDPAAKSESASTVQQSTGTGAQQQPPAGTSKACLGATPDQITASVSFKTHSRHRVWSVGIEAGWDMGENSKYAMSGYAFQPLAQGGPDQLYQLQGESKPVDRVVFSALFLVYPFGGECTGGGITFCTNHLGFGFGPTFWRGAGAEPFRQWNLRVLYEITSGVLVSTGPSWRSYDAPSDQIGTVVSVSRPGQTPPLQTYPQWAAMWTAGLTVDLSLLGDAVSAVSNAASSSTSSATGGKTGGKP
jgi:hypothetical protein